MRFGNAHVFNLYCENLGGNGIQSTANAATLVENVYFHHPQSGSLPTREENGGPTGIVKVVNSVIVNLPGVNVQFREFGQTNFVFNAPFAGANIPYSYTNSLDPVANVPSVVTNWAGTGKISF
jgi:pectate lyase